MSGLDGYERDGDAGAALVLADRALEDGDDRLAAAALSRAHGLVPHDDRVARLLSEVLDRLSLEEHGLVWRYVPMGTLRMGSETGDPDERPVHPVPIEGFWLMDAPMTWADDARLRGWTEPPNGAPEPPPEGFDMFQLAQFDKLRSYYSSDDPDERWESNAYRKRPMVAVGWQDAESLARQLSGGTVWYGLPTEAEWEWAARGGRIGSRFPWGDERPAPGELDHDNLGAFAIADPRTTRPNAYGIYAMCGTVWEWTADWYDALAYTGASPPEDQTEERERVIRGGSWADSLAACTVSFRASLGSTGMGSEDWGPNMTPTIGYRLARYDRLPRHLNRTLVPPERR